MLDRLATMVLVPLVTVAAAGCGDGVETGCTAIGCGPTVEVQFEPRLVEEGRWTLSATDGVAAGRCTIDIPTSQTGGCVNAPSNAGIHIHARIDFEPGVVGFGVEFTREPGESVTIRLAREDEVVADKTVQPDYEVSHPNGPNCEPTCYDGGTVVLEIPAGSLGGAVGM